MPVHNVARPPRPPRPAPTSPHTHTHCTSMLGGVVSTVKEAVAGVPSLPTLSTAYTAAGEGGRPEGRGDGEPLLQLWAAAHKQAGDTSPPAFKPSAGPQAKQQQPAPPLRSRLRTCQRVRPVGQLPQPFRRGAGLEGGRVGGRRRRAAARLRPHQRAVVVAALLTGGEPHSRGVGGEQRIGGVCRGLRTSSEGVGVGHPWLGMPFAAAWAYAKCWAHLQNL